MSAVEGRDYHLVWPRECERGPDHDPIEDFSPASYTPAGAYCMRCRAHAVVLPEPPVKGTT